MNNRLISAAGLLTAFSLAPAAWGLDVSRTKTGAAILQSATGARQVEVGFAAELSNNGFLNLTREQVVVGWQQVGGVEPEPFRVLIPAGCFVARRVGGFQVEDFRGCGVRIAFGRLLQLSIVDFEARLVPRDDGTWRFNIQASVMDGGQALAILGAMGGAAVDISLGRESARSLPVSAGTVSGVDPEPF